MIFLDKLGNIAKNTGDITNDAIEITKLNDKINIEKLEVSELMIKIGVLLQQTYNGRRTCSGSS